MFAFKIEYKGKVLNLGKDMTSLQNVQQDIKKRFPIDFKIGVKYFYANQEVTAFETLRKIAHDSKLASIKVRIEPKKIATLENSDQDLPIASLRPQTQFTQTVEIKQTQEKPILQQRCAFSIYSKVQTQKQSQKIERQCSSVSFKSSVQNDTMKDDEKIEQVFAKRESSVKKSKSVSRKNSASSVKSKSAQKFLSFGQKQNKDTLCESYKQKIAQEVKKAIGVQFGKGKFEQNEPIVMLINQIVQKKVIQILERFNIIPKQIQEKKQSYPQPCDLQKKISIENLSFRIIQTVKMPEKIQKGTKLNYLIKIINTGEDFPGEMELYDDDNGFEMKIAKLRSGESQEVNIGPIAFQKLGKIKKSYKIGYFDKNTSFKFIKENFGFEVMVQRDQKKSLLTNNFRRRVMEAAKTIKSKQSIEYLIEKFREIGITQENSYQSSDQIILDIIKSLQKN